MPTIPVLGGFETIVDEDVYYQIRLLSWRIHNRKKKPLYVCANVQGKLVFLHRFVMNAPKGFMVDHRNGDTMDNRRENLRLCTNSQNQANRSDSRGTSLYKGVSFDRDRERWIAAIGKSTESLYLGSFESQEDAARAYNTKALELFGEFACLNLVPAMMVPPGQSGDYGSPRVGVPRLIAA